MSTIKPLAIFPHIPSEVQEIIISNCDAYSLVTLSGVNVSGAENLTSKVFFQAYFIKQHPRLKPYDRLFTVLCSTHPNNCWKVVCQIMPFPKHPLRIPSRLSLSFIQEAVEKIQLQINECEQIDKSICGSGYKDPNSPIDRKWKKFKEYEEESNKATSEYQFQKQQLREAINLEFEGKQVEVDVMVSLRIFNQFRHDVQKFLSSSYEEFVEKSPEENGAISKDQFSYCQKVTKIHLLTSPLLEESGRLLKLKLQSLTKYTDLEKQRWDNLTKKKLLSNCLANPGQAHIEALSAEWRTAVELETDLNTITSLEDCHALIVDLIKNPEKRTLEAHQKILGFINSWEHGLRKGIWYMLYYRCANQMIEDRWAEKHCMDHLSELEMLIKDELASLNSYVNAVGSKYMSRISALINSDDDVTTVSNHFLGLNLNQ